MSLSLGVRAPGALLANQTLAGAGGSGSAVVFLPPGSSSATLIANLTAVPGGSVAFTIAEVDPVDQTTVIGSSKSGTLSSKTFAALTISLVGLCVLVSWTNSGTNTGVDAFVGGGSAQAIAQTNKFSSALEASRVVSTSATAKLRSIDCRIDSTAPASTYYLLLIDAISLPANGAVTLLAKPRKRVTSGVDDEFGVDFGERGIGCTVGIVVALSTTEFTLTIAGAYGSFEAEV